MTPLGWLGRKTSTQTNNLSSANSNCSRQSSIFCFHFSYKIKLEMSCESSAWQIIPMKCRVLFFSEKCYHNNRKYWERQVFANSVDPDQMAQNAASDLSLDCLPYIQQYFRQVNFRTSMVNEGVSILRVNMVIQKIDFNPYHAEYIKMPCLLLISSQSYYLIRIFDRNSHI